MWLQKAKPQLQCSVKHTAVTEVKILFLVSGCTYLCITNKRNIKYKKIPDVYNPKSFSFIYCGGASGIASSHSCGTD